MKRPPRTLTSQMEHLIKTALAPGHFVSYNATFSFVSELEAVERELAKLIPTDPTQAVALYETFLAGCYEKAEEIDDSSGSFGQFVDELYCGWIKARRRPVPIRPRRRLACSGGWRRTRTSTSACHAPPGTCIHMTVARPLRAAPEVALLLLG
jgi:hypothetical protein